MQYYYFNLPKDIEHDFQGNLKASYDIQISARRAFEPFETFLRNAITALEKKENIKAKWKPIKTENIAELRLMGKLYEVPKETIVQVDEVIADEIQVGNIIRGSEKDHTVISIRDCDVIFDTIPEKDEMLFWNKKTFEYTIILANQPQGTIIREEEQRYIIYAENNHKPSHNASKIPHKKTK